MSWAPAFISFCCCSTASSNEQPLAMLRACAGLVPAASSSDAEARKMACGDLSFSSTRNVPTVPRPGTIRRRKPVQCLILRKHGSCHVEYVLAEGPYFSTTPGERYASYLDWRANRRGQRCSCRGLRVAHGNQRRSMASSASLRTGFAR